MQIAKPGIPDTIELDRPEVLLSMISTLAHHLAIELDLNYEDSQKHQLADELKALEAAVAILFFNGLIAPDTVYHTMHRFDL